MRLTIKTFLLFLKLLKLDANIQKASNTKSLFLLTITTFINL